MLRQDLARLGAWARGHLAASPWSPGVGLGRSALALGTAGTLISTPARVLLSPLANGLHPPACTGLGRLGLWCVLPQAQHEVARWLSVAVLLVVASGWRPRLTGIPHWWVSWSLILAATVQDGGDQVTAVLALLLIPVALTDPRKWHWRRADRDSSFTATTIASTALFLVRLQVAIIYLDAGLAKLGVPQWADGTAMYYWFHSVLFAPPPWLSPITTRVTDSPLGVTMLTWGAIVLEVALGLALLFPRRAQVTLLSLGLLLHDCIALTMGLISFDFAMSAALVLYLLPPDWEFRRPRWLPRRARPPAESVADYPPGLTQGQVAGIRTG
jgi:antimicrobial peptide system SdpB family protein